MVLRLWGLADLIDDEIVDFYPGRGAAGQAAKDCLTVGDSTEGARVVLFGGGRTGRR